MKYILVIIADNNPGVLNRVVSLFRQRQYNIESLCAGHTELNGVSHITTLIDDTPSRVTQVAKQINKLIDIREVKVIEYKNSFCKESIFLKINLNPTNRSDILQLGDTFEAHVEEMHCDNILFSLTDSPEKISEFIEVMVEFGILELRKTGIMAINNLKHV